MNTVIHWQQRTAVVALLLTAGLSSGCASIRTGSHYDETTNFGAYETFSWIDAVPYISDSDSIQISPLTQNKIQQAIQDRLIQKGFNYVDNRNDADFVVAYTVGTRDKIRTEYYPAAYRGNWGWHVYDSHYYIREYRDHSYTEGTLGVDIFDSQSRKPVWHGWAQKTISETDRKDPSSIIRDGVAQLLESFPH